MSRKLAPTLVVVLALAQSNVCADAETLKLALCSVKPRLLHAEPPVLERLDPPLHGRVVLEVTVDTMGHVRDPVVIESSDDWFAEAALNAIVKWSFQPQAMECRARVPVEYQLKD